MTVAADGGGAAESAVAPDPPRPTLAAWLDAIEEGMSAGAELALRRERARAIYDAVRPLIGRIMGEARP